MRVIAGKCRSLQLQTPKGLDTRPTQDRIKETLFNMIRDYVYDSVFIDLFAGSGGIGIEALSRGAKHCYFIDNSKSAIECINNNLKHTSLSDSATVMQRDFNSALNQINEKRIDVVFIDPPYKAGFEAAIFDNLYHLSYITEDTLIIIEADIGNDINPDGFEIIKEKLYKTNKHLFLRKKHE